MLATQSFLINGGTLSDLKAQYAIKGRINKELNCVSLNYDMLNSPSGSQIVEECRALILELNTWNVLSWPFQRFYNYGQPQAGIGFNWNNFDVFNKLDGSLVSLWFTPDATYHFSTKSVPDASCGCDGSDKTYNSLIRSAIISMTNGNLEDFISYFIPGYSYALELTTPENQLVVQNKEKKLTLLAIRNLTTLKEVKLSDWVRDMGYPYPIAPSFKGNDLEQVKQKVLAINPMEEEGYVLVDDNFNRIKMKSEGHFLLSRCRDSLGKSPKTRLEMILLEKVDDVWPTQPVWIQNKLTDMMNAIKELSYTIQTQFNLVNNITSNQKDFALLVKDVEYKAALFTMRKDSSVSAMDWIRTTGLKNPGNMLKILKNVVSSLDVKEEQENG